MDLIKTTILPTDDKKLALRMFLELVNERPHVLMVIHGRDTDAETFVKRADRLAGNPDDPRWVVWARKPEHIAEAVNDLRDPSMLFLDGRATSDETLGQSRSETRGFCLSLSDEVRDVIHRADPVPDLVRIVQAFAKAEQSSRREP